MYKRDVLRIVYYTRKVRQATERGAHVPRNRVSRLLAYKAAMNERLEAERRRPLW
ncbi:hypothetical protein BN871_AT_00640 [Paenibacillus sp. P22]|nr:hypothetical protein BN871_AT_00640 [Paenibacillus sp. P22]